MSFPVQRPRRLRSNENIRRMVRETVLSVDDLVLPCFCDSWKGCSTSCGVHAGIYNYSIDML